MAEPKAFAAGVYVSVPLGLTAGPAAKREGLELLSTTKVSVCADSLAGPAEIAVAQPEALCAPESSSTVWSAPLLKLGASLTGLTVS